MKYVVSSARKNTVRLALVSALMLGTGALVASCQSDKDIDITKLGVQTDPPEELYNQGLANIKAGNMTEAGRKFDAIDREHPFTDSARKALVMSTFIKYRQGDYESAIQSGKRYMKQYSNSDDSDYVLYLMCQSAARTIVDVTQDQRNAQRTVDICQELLDNYPQSQYADEAQKQIRYARNNLAGKEMQIGRYYLERKEYLASINRFRIVVEKYSNTNQIEEALARLVEAYYAMGITSEAQTAAAVLGRNYPDSQWYADSYKLLQSGGLEPRENAGSWISRAGKKLLLGT
jgi:outer membrane protein assembly factor BamD